MDYPKWTTLKFVTNINLTMYKPYDKHKYSWVFKAVTKSGTGTWGLGRGTRVWDVGRVGWDVGTWGRGTWGRGDVGRGTWGRGEAQSKTSEIKI